MYRKKTNVGIKISLCFPLRTTNLPFLCSQKYNIVLAKPCKYIENTVYESKKKVDFFELQNIIFKFFKH